MLHLRKPVEYALWSVVSSCRHTVAVSSMCCLCRLVVCAEASDSRKMRTAAGEPGILPSGTSETDVRRPDAPLGRWCQILVSFNSTAFNMGVMLDREVDSAVMVGEKRRNVGS